MAQQLKNGSFHNGSVTYIFADSDRYAVVNPAFQGKHRKPQTDEYKKRRKLHWFIRKHNKVVVVE